MHKFHHQKGIQAKAEKALVTMLSLLLNVGETASSWALGWAIKMRVFRFDES